MTLHHILQRNFRPNILIIGSETAADEMLNDIRSLLDGPIQTCQFPGPLQLPPNGHGALILRNVGALAAEQQVQLMQWLDTVPGVPVVSLNTSSLFALVSEGAFSQPLYYRLNTVLEHADPMIGRMN